MTTTATPLPARACTCHPDDKMPKPCPAQYAYRDCIGILESRALSQLTDEQALVTWERFKAVQKAYVAAILAEVAE